MSDIIVERAQRISVSATVGDRDYGLSTTVTKVSEVDRVLAMMRQTILDRLGFQEGLPELVETPTTVQYDEGTSNNRDGGTP